MCKKMCILLSRTKFSAGWPLLPAYNFLATMATAYSTYRLGAVASLKFLAIENMAPWPYILELPRVMLGLLKIK